MVENLYNLRLAKDLLDITSRQSIKIIDKLDFIKIKNSYYLEREREKKRQNRLVENTCKSYIS